jgi:tetratricopeptide (TPR) repeat protein
MVRRMPWKRLAPAAGLLLLTAVAYLPAMRGAFVWDDDDYLAKNEALRTSDGLRRIWLDPNASPQFYPLVFTSFWAEYRLWGLNPAGFHIVNILLHGVNAILLWLVLRRLGVPGAWLAAALWALHPVNVESVAWVQERKNVLSGLFYFAAVLAYFHFSPPRPAEQPARVNRWTCYALALVLGVCALLSKTATCTLPAALLLLAVWQHGRGAWHDLLALLPLFAVCVTMGLVTIWVEKHHVGAEGEDWALSAGQRFLLAGRALWFYLGKAVWPVTLTFIYPRWEIDTDVWWQWLYPLLALVMTFVLILMRRRLGAGPLIAWLFFAGTLAPTLGAFNVFFFRFSYVADHFQYLALAAPLALAAAYLTKGSKRLGVAPWPPAAAAGVLLFVLAALTWRQAEVYRDPEQIWAETLHRNPSCWMAHYNLGCLALKRNDPSAALGHFPEAARLRPEFADAYINWAVALLQLGRPAEARPQLERALALDSRRTEVHVNLGVAHAQLGDPAAAANQFQEALLLDETNVRAHFNLGLARAQQGKADEAVRHFQAALALQPNNPEAYFELGKVYAGRQQLDEAIACHKRAVALRPSLASYRFALAEELRQQGQDEAAERELQEALRLAPRQLGP